MRTLDESIIRMREISGMLEAAMDLGGAAQALEALRWVADRGGLDAVKAQRSDYMPRAAYERKKAGWLGHIRECETALAKRNERIRELERELKADGCRACESLRWVDGHGGIPAIEARIMPDGMSWPRTDTSEPVRFGDQLIDDDALPEFREVDTIVFQRTDDGYTVDVENCRGCGHRYKPGERVKRPAPKVLDADGVEIELGDDLYSVEGGLKLHVGVIDTRNGKIATAAMYALDKWADPAMYTHRAPVLAADGKPLREGETVWTVDAGIRFEVHSIEGDTVWGSLDGDRTDDGLDSKSLTHQRPDSWVRLEEDAEKFACEYFGRGGKKDTCTGCRSREIDPCTAKDCEFNKTIDLVRRTKALAERDR